MWGHEYEKIKREKRRQALWVTALLVLVLGLLAIPVVQFFSLSAAERQLLGAARSGDVTALRAALDAGADPNVRNRRGQTALHVAAWHGRVTAIRTLVAAGADVNARDDRAGETPLHTASRAARSDTVIVLLGAGARSSLRTLAQGEPDIRGNRHPPGVTALEIAEAAEFDAVAAVLPGGRPAADPTED